MKKIILLIILALNVIICCSGCSGNGDNTSPPSAPTVQNQWVYNDITQGVPVPWFGTVTKSVARYDNFTICYSDITKSSCESYIYAVKKSGFSINVSRIDKINSISYSADDKWGRHLSFDYYTGGITISVDSPKK